MTRAYPLVVLVLIGTLVLFLRVFQLQVDEHQVWAGEAERLVHSGSVDPYRRGRLKDSRGRVLARDRDAYHLVLKYRSFRRGHPLGQLAHARSSLEVRPVPLGEALAHMDAWTDELLDLDIYALEAFGAGAALAMPSFVIGATDRPEAELRRLRASDLRYYVGSLLELDRLEWVALRKVRREPEGPLSFAAFAARERGMESAEQLKAERRRRNTEALDSLDLLAQRLEWKTLSNDDPRRMLVPLERLVEQLEERRWAVENATAGRLFREATGFVAGRVDPQTLARYFDLDWIRKALRWDEERLFDWLEHATRVFRDDWRDEYALSHMARALCSVLPEDPAAFDAAAAGGLPGRAGDGHLADRVVSSLAALFGDPEVLRPALDGDPVAWRELGPLAVFADVASLFEADVPEDFRPESFTVLPVQAQGLREWKPKRAQDAWRLLDYVRGDDTGAASASAWRLALATQDREVIVELARDLVLEWDGVFQERLGAVLAAIARDAEPAERARTGALRLAEERLSRATERARFIRKDYGNRSVMIDRRPSYDVVSLLTRYPKRFPGFEPRDARERMRVVLEDEPGALAEPLIGGITSIDADEVQSQRLHARRMTELRLEPSRTPEEDAEFARLLSIVRQSDEVRGAEGLEALFDAVLRGRNGYNEHRGLEDVYGKGVHWQQFKSVVHGKDVQLTLDAEVQRAAEFVLENPILPSTENQGDPRWFEAPVGAIGLVTVEGDVICAASVPNAYSNVDPDGPGQRAIVAERTLRRLTFQPIGSVFKPFVAAWMLENLELSPLETVECTRRDGITGKASYGGVRCSSTYGHGVVDLARALEVSCNCYFAWAGDQLSLSDLVAITTEFGFGHPTGAASFSGGGGLMENAQIPWSDWQYVGRTKRLAANGLGVLEGTVMQVARATAGMATGWLPELRFIDSVEGTPVPRVEPREIDIDPRYQRFIRDAMFAVANGPEGTARKALSAGRLGFEIAAKTGSADYSNGGARKHAWVACFFPPEDPVAALVVFLHDTTANASHGAVHVARQFLQTSEFQGWLAAHELRKARAREVR